MYSSQHTRTHACTRTHARTHARTHTHRRTHRTHRWPKVSVLTKGAGRGGGSVCSSIIKKKKQQQQQETEICMGISTKTRGTHSGLPRGMHTFVYERTLTYGSAVAHCSSRSLRVWPTAETIDYRLMVSQIRCTRPVQRGSLYPSAVHLLSTQR